MIPKIVFTLGKYSVRSVDGYLVVSGINCGVNLGDDVTITASVGEVTQDPGNAGLWQWALLTTDGPEQTQTVIITADDGNGGVTTSSFELTVNNLAPVSDVVSASDIEENSPAGTFVGLFSAIDPGSSSPRKVLRAAVRLSSPAATRAAIRLICWIPWETPIAKTRKGTRIASGSTP